MLTFSVPKKLISSGGKKSATEDRPTENSPEKDFLSFFGFSELFCRFILRPVQPVRAKGLRALIQAPYY